MQRRQRSSSTWGLGQGPARSRAGPGSSEWVELRVQMPPVRDGGLRAQQSQSTPEATSKKLELSAMGGGRLLGCWDQRALYQLCRGPAATTYSNAPSKCGSSAEAEWLGSFQASGKALRKVGKGFTGLSLQPSGPGVLCSPEGPASARAPSCLFPTVRFSRLVAVAAVRPVSLEACHQMPRKGEGTGPDRQGPSPARQYGG